MRSVGPEQFLGSVATDRLDRPLLVDVEVVVIVATVS
jgi:hypothetical protein